MGLNLGSTDRQYTLLSGSRIWSLSHPKRKTLWSRRCSSVGRARWNVLLKVPVFCRGFESRRVVGKICRIILATPSGKCRIKREVWGKNKENSVVASLYFLLSHAIYLRYRESAQSFIKVWVFFRWSLHSELIWPYCTKIFTLHLFCPLQSNMTLV